MITQTVLHLVVDLGSETGQATERRLDVPARTAEAVIEVEVAKGGVEIVHPHELDHAAAKPNAFGVSGRSADRLRCFDELVDLVLIVLGRLGTIGGGFAGLILGALVTALGIGASQSEQHNYRGHYEMAPNRMMKFKHPSPHGFPDFLVHIDRPAAVELG